MKSYQGSFYLSGNAACRWYFSPQIPEAREFYTSFQPKARDMVCRSTSPATISHTCVPAQLEEKNLSDLNIIDPYDFSKWIPLHCYYCTSAPKCIMVVPILHQVQQVMCSRWHWI